MFSTILSVLLRLQPPRLALGADIDVQYFPNEDTLLDAFIFLVRFHDPELILGYEIQRESLGYLIERAGHLKRYSSASPECLYFFLSFILLCLSNRAYADELARVFVSAKPPAPHFNNLVAASYPKLLYAISFCLSVSYTFS
jgi:hypothetical protein